MTPLPLDTYLTPDVVSLARELLGKSLFTQIDGEITGGIITETEAYRAPEDKASHAYGNRRTPRTEVMFGPGGHAYVYLCYGIHHLFNIVTNVEGAPHAILVRAIEPTHGLETMRARRQGKRTTTGPGTLSQALGITTAHSGTPLTSNQIWIADLGHSPKTVTASPRVGIGYAEEWIDRPWRFQTQLPNNSLTLDTASQ